MGARSDRLRQIQIEMEQGPPPLTRATEDRLEGRARMGVVTYLCLALAGLGALWALDGLATASPPALMKGLGGAIFWGLLAWLNEFLRARQRRRRNG